MASAAVVDEDVDMTGGGGGGAGGGAGATDAASTKPSLAQYVLSTQLVDGDGARAHDGAVESVCTTAAGHIVTGGGDSMAKIWQYFPETNAYTVLAVVPASGMGSVKVLVPLPDSGFVAGSKDGVIRVFSEAGELVKALEGHEGAIRDLAMSPQGLLLSGGSDGTARVWNLKADKGKECAAVLKGHEPLVMVTALADGTVVTGTGGVPNLETRTYHDSTIRIFGSDGTVTHKLKDHTQPIMGLATYGDGFVSVSNDGTIKVRRKDGTIVNTFKSTMHFEGRERNGVQRVAIIDDVIATCQEDRALRLYADKGLVQEMLTPSYTWDITRAPNGDLISVGAQGAVFAWTKVAARAADTTTQQAFIEAATEAAKPPGSGSDPLQGLKDGGSYEDRDTRPGASDNERKAFKKASGQYMVCMWSAATQKWIDIGELVTWDVNEIVDLDVPGQGMKQVQLTFNISEDVDDITNRFMTMNKLDRHFRDQVREMIASTWKARGGTYTKATAVTVTRMTYFPQPGYVPITKAKLDKALVALQGANPKVAAAAAGSALDDGEMSQIGEVVKTLRATSYYHSSKFVPQQITALKKLATWPVAHLVPVMDVLRVFVVHPDGAAKLAGSYGPILARVAELVADESTPYAVLLLCLRLVNNLFQHDDSRAAVTKASSELLDAIAGHVAHDKKPIRGLVASILLHFSKEIHFERPQCSDDTAVQVGLLIIEMLEDETNSQAVIAKALVALGHMLLCNKPLFDKIVEGGAKDAVIAGHIMTMAVAQGEAVISKTVQELQSLVTAGPACFYSDFLAATGKKPM